jgi:hypothetical protein
MQNRLMTCVVGLVAGLALAACGDVQQASGTLEVASVPTAQVAIDGTPHGTTPATIKLDAGRHEIVLSRDHFEPQTQAVEITGGDTSTVETVLMGTDPGDPEVIRALAEAFEIDYQPFEGVERHRGSRDKDQPVVLLWPQKDVRLDGLVTFGVEVSIDYMGDGYLVFKKGRKELSRQPFTPEKVMTVAVLPTEVREAVKTGNTITWGLYFDDNRKSVTTKFKVVKNTKVEKAIAKLERRKYFKRQPPLTQALMRAQVLHNHRLYTESLLAHLGVVQEFPTSVQPYEGIVTALRRMDGDASELWTLASQHVSGKGGHGRPSQPGAGFGAAPGMGPSGMGGSRPAMPGMGANEIPLRLYDPRIETPTAPPVEQPGTTTQPDATQPGTTDPATPGTAQPGLGATDRPGDPGELIGRADALRAVADDERQRANDLREQADAAREMLERAIQDSNETLADIQQADEAVEAAREAHAADPTPANEEALREAQQYREELQAKKDELDKSLPGLSEHADRLNQEAVGAEDQAVEAERLAAEARREADLASGIDPDAPTTRPTPELGPGGKPIEQPAQPSEGPVLDQMRRELGDAQIQLAEARRDLETLEVEAAANPGDPGIQTQLAEMRQRVEEMETTVAAVAEAYAAAGGQHAPETPELPDARERNLRNLTRALQTAEFALVAAEDALRQAEEDLQTDPSDPAKVAAFEAAQQAAQAAADARNAAAAALEAATTSK